MTGVTLILGKPFTGKTARLLHELQDEPRVLLVDAKLGELTTIKRYDHLFLNGVTDWVDYLRAACDGRKFRAVFHIRHEQSARLENICSLLPHVRGLVLAIDELSLFVPPGRFLKWTAAMFTSGTHDGVRVVGTAQRPSLVNVTARASAGRMLLYRMTEGNDLDALRTYLPSELHDAIPALPEYVCVDWADGRDPFIDRSFVGKLAGFLPPRPF
jgi:hypothetical protein